MVAKRSWCCLQALTLFVCFLSVFCVEDSSQVKMRQKRSEQRPYLELSVLPKNVTAMMTSGSTFLYQVALKHTAASKGDAQGVQILFILNPFVIFKELKAFTFIKPTHEQKNDSIMFKLKDVIWSSEPNFEFSVTFNGKKLLEPGKHHVVTHAQVTYYDEYVEDEQGLVTKKGTFFSEPMKTMEFDIEIPGCTAPLGMKSKEIQDYQMSASSSYAEAQPSQAREFDDGWCAKSTKGEQYLQIDFVEMTRITGLGTIRRQSKPHWITAYSVKYSNDNKDWKVYTENGFPKVFTGNSNAFTASTHWLMVPFNAWSIRIVPSKWEILICLRLELYGCKVKGSSKNCISPLGMETGEIPNEALSDRRAVVSPSDMNQPGYARLNVKVPVFPYGWESISTTEYLQIDFGSLRRVTRVAVQGAYTAESYTLFFVSSYKLSYSNNTIDWIEYKENGLVKTISGPVTEYDAKYPVIEIFKTPFDSRYVRFYPLYGGTAGMKVMRVELYGCLKDPVPQYKTMTDLNYYRRSFIVDPVTDEFYICMYTENRAESSCFVTMDSKAWNAIDANIIAMLAANPRDREVYAFDRQMNLHRSRDSGSTWFQVSREYYDRAGREVALHQAKGVPENLVSALPTVNTTITTSKGAKWGVSAGHIHFMTAGNSSWNTVGVWKCCGM